jgi:hypothetical protein
MTYHYGDKTAWLDDLLPDPGPHTYDLCPTHADRLGVPVGWERTDRRTATVRLLFARIAV